MNFKIGALRLCGAVDVHQMALQYSPACCSPEGHLIFQIIVFRRCTLRKSTKVRSLRCQRHFRLIGFTKFSKFRTTPGEHPGRTADCLIENTSIFSTLFLLGSMMYGQEKFVQRVGS